MSHLRRELALTSQLRPPLTNLARKMNLPKKEQVHLKPLTPMLQTVMHLTAMLSQGKTNLRKTRKTYSIRVHPASQARNREEIDKREVHQVMRDQGDHHQSSDSMRKVDQSIQTTP
jgi:hypothetical protein